MSKEAALAIATGQPAPVAAPTEGVASGEVKQEANSGDPRVQALIKKEVRLVKEQEAIKKERTEWEAKVKTAEELIARDKLFDETKSKDVVAALKMLGFSDTEIFNSLAATAPKDKTPEDVAREAALDEIKKADDKRAALEAERMQADNTKLIKNLEAKIVTTISADPDKYEFCKFHGEAAQDLIFSTIEEVLKEEKKLLTPSEAADLVESFYEENAKAMDALKKRKPAVEPAQVEPVSEVKVQTPQAGKPKTLTNNVRATVAGTATKKESPTEKRARLENALRMGINPSALRD